MTLKQTMRVQSRLILWAACLMLVFGAGLVWAQDNCDLSFCDRDGDGLPRDHKKCRGCDPPFDCDDSNPDLTDNCDGGTSLAYTAKLTGAFVFAGFPDGVPVFPSSGGDVLLSAEQAYMLRPEDGDSRLTWNNAFVEVCPGLGEVPDGILAAADSWAIRGYGAVHVSLRDFQLDVDGEPWEIWIQLIGEEEPGDPFLPAVGEPRVFPLPYVSLWGKPANKKGRKSDCIGGPLPHELLHPTPGQLTITAVP